MNVLVACEESQRVCMAFRERGHNAFSADLQEPSGGHPEWHIIGDALKAIQGGQIVTMDGVTHDIPKWDLLIAHPPCTYLSSAGSSNLLDSQHRIKNNERYAKALEAKAFFMQFLSADCDRICVENPAVIKMLKLPKYSQIIEPYLFGDPWKKRTCLWLKGLPPLIPTKIVKPLGCWVNATGPNCRTKLRLKKGKLSAKDRSKTFHGVAVAMATQWTEDISNGLKN